MKISSVDRAIHGATQELASTGRAPSLHVMVEAAKILRAGSVTLDTHSSLVYDFAYSGKAYVVVLRMDDYGFIMIDRSTCTCDAGRAKKTCKHLAASLADAYDYGYKVAKETPS